MFDDKIPNKKYIRRDVIIHDQASKPCFPVTLVFPTSNHSIIMSKNHIP